VEEAREFTALGGGEVMTTFSEYAVKELKAQFNNHDDRVGSQLFDANPSKFRGLKLKRTDCITYVIECLEAGFEGVGDSAAKTQVRQLGKYGTKLASYLVNTKKWVGIHINPDEYHPDDGEQEHPYSSYVSYAALKLVKFGFGLSKGGLHTWLFNEGKVYEVHWNELPTSGNLYEATDLNRFMWNSGAIIIPKDQESKLATLSGLSCSG